MKRVLYIILAAALSGAAVFAQARLQEDKPADLYFQKFKPFKAPQPAGLGLKTGDRLAICGDSITEQKMYSRIMETYLTVCEPELQVSVRQFGWGGEKADGFLQRMTNDVLRFKPTVATTCYGMNDHLYQRYEPAIGDAYRANSTAVVQAFKHHGVRVVMGSPGCVGKKPAWSKDTYATMESLNLNLCELRNIGIEIAEAEKTGFADVFWPMLQADYSAWRIFGQNYAVAGKDGVHPNWAGHTIMAHAFLKALGLDGNIGTVVFPIGGKKAETTGGHEVVSFKDNVLTLKSARYPFCAAGDPSRDDSIRSGMKLVPFNEDLNRFMLVARNVKKKQNYRVTWGKETKVFSSDSLAAGINLAREFAVNPFSEAFGTVDEAVAAKQAFETKQIKQLFRSTEAKTNMEEVVARSEKERDALVEAVRAAFVPVTHTIKIEPAE